MVWRPFWSLETPFRSSNQKHDISKSFPWVWVLPGDNTPPEGPEAEANALTVFSEIETCALLLQDPWSGPFYATSLEMNRLAPLFSLTGLHRAFKQQKDTGSTPSSFDI